MPVTAYDKDGVRVLVNFASECPPGRPDVLVVVVTTVNTAPVPVHNMVLHAAVPKVNAFRLTTFKCNKLTSNDDLSFHLPPVNEGKAAASIRNRTGTV